MGVICGGQRRYKKEPTFRGPIEVSEISHRVILGRILDVY